MKKVFLIVGTIVVVVGVVLIGREGAQSASDGLRRDMENKKCISCPGCSSKKDGGSLASTIGGNEAISPPGDGGVASTKQSPQSALSAGNALSAAVKALLLQDGKKHNYPSLLQAIAELNYTLSAADVAALLEMLAWPNDRFPEKMRPIEINAVKNDVLDKLLRQETLPEGIGLKLVEMAGNATQDAVWRDYCVQFMDPCYERLSLATKEHKEPKSQGSEGAGNYSVHNHSVEKEAVREAMFQALDERDSTIAGTALIGLENLSRTHGEFDRELIAAKAVEIASDGMASTESRMTALRLASGLATKERKENKDDSFVGSASSSTAGLGISNSEQGTRNAEVVRAARVLAQTGETVYMRSAAIVTLGEVGSEVDRELLESFAMDGNRQIAEAARLALAKLDAPESASTAPEVGGRQAPAAKDVERKAPVLVNQP